MKNINNSNYIRTDLAMEAELPEPENEGDYGHGITCSERDEGGVKITVLKIAGEEGERILKKSRGTYVTIETGKLWLRDDDFFSKAAGILSEEIRKMASELAPGYDSALIAGLGNRYITSDAVGPLAVKGINVTRHIKSYSPELFGRLGSFSVSAVSPGVVGQTGIETSELILGAVRSASPSLLVAIDALAARSVDRLATTVQLSDNGIAPGSGIGNRRNALDRKLLGIPVISIGVPTVVDSSTLVRDMLDKAGVDDISEPLRRELDNGRSFFVSLKDSDTAVAEMSRLISRAVNCAFTIE